MSTTSDIASVPVLSLPHRLRRPVRLSLAALSLWGCAHQSSAAGVSSSDFVLGIVNTAGLCQGAQSVSGTTTTTHGSSITSRVNCGGPTWSETAAASAEFGTLRALGDLRFNNFSFGPSDEEFHFIVRSEAGFRDTLTFSTGSFWEFTVGIDGQSVATNGNRDPGDASTVWCFNMFAAGCGISPYGVSTLGSHTFRFPISPARTVGVAADLSIDIEANLFRDRLPSDFLLTSDIFVDLSHTVRLVSSRVLDANGQPISNAAIRSESGFDYAGVSPVPEPSIYASVSFGLIGLALFTRRRLRSEWKLATVATAM